MALYIIQHGLSLPEDIDPERGLSDRGIEETELTAKKAAEAGIRPDIIVHSGKKRAEQTALILAGYLHPEITTAAAGINPKDPVEPFADSLDMSGSRMIVGHLPFLEKLVSFLVTGKTEPRVFRLQNSGILCLDIVDRAWTIKWSIMPDIS